MKKRKLEVVVISDTKLGKPECRAEELLIYLSSIKPKILVLNGDILGQPENNLDEYPRSHAKVLEKLRLFSLEGTKIFYLKGDQDMFLRKSKNNIPGICTIDKELFLQIDGKRVWILHGDVFDTPFYLSEYIRLYWKKGLEFLFANRDSKNRFPGDEKKTSMSITRNKTSNNVKESSNCLLEQRAVDRALRKGIDTVICGHNHQPKKAYHNNQNGQCQYLNSGDWVTHLTALEYAF
ncbi:MAG: UDP-2,3-diacylglucosamine diphosphatase, partial [Flavobacteriaceae bacterium]|nr:UDP-2,3-diacylglucosamine diphosphatase [Flavobacteriaceae bacterium]